MGSNIYKLKCEFLCLVHNHNKIDPIESETGKFHCALALEKVELLQEL